RGIPTVVPLALGEVWKGIGPNDSFLITETLEQTQPLSTFLESTVPTFAKDRQVRLRQRLAVELGNFLAQLHQAGVVHNDLHAGNMLLRLESDDAPRLFLIDLHAVNLERPLGWGQSRENLVMLNRWF